MQAGDLVESSDLTADRQLGTSEVKRGNLDFYIIYYRIGPVKNGNNPLSDQRRLYFEIDKAHINFTATATSDYTGHTYSAIPDGVVFHFKNLPVGSYALSIIPDYSSDQRTFSARVVESQTTSCAQEEELAQQYEGRLRVSIAAGANLRCHVVLSYSNKDYTIQDDRIAVDTMAGEQSYEGVVEYYPIPWGSYAGRTVLTGAGETNDMGNIEITVNNSHADAWLVIKQSK
ncbi:MAG: hypothetical protein PHW04_09280 [Candidatus Wallbacteria bacterium]|nr:hypothetical protein [Candidatus Wallbacteria bacterium]